MHAVLRIHALHVHAADVQAQPAAGMQQGQAHQEREKALMVPARAILRAQVQGMAIQR